MIIYIFENLSIKMKLMAMVYENLQVQENLLNHDWSNSPFVKIFYPKSLFIDLLFYQIYTIR